jgi:hypothetical protein
MNRLSILAVCIAFPLMAQTSTIQPTAPGPASETRTFALQSGGRLKINNVNGSIKIAAWGKDEVKLVANFKPSRRKREHPRIEVSSSNESMVLTVKYPKGWNTVGSCDMELNVPKRVQSSIQTVNGKIAISETIGELNAGTVNGNVALESVSGRTNASTVNGDIDASFNNVDKHVSMTTVNGSIKVKLLNPSGNLLVSTVNGSVAVDAPGARDIVTKRGRFEAKFGDGDENMSFSTVNGSVHIE